MPTLATIALVTSAVVGAGSAIDQRSQGKKAAKKTKKEGQRKGREREALQAEQLELEEKEKSKVKRDEQRRSRISKRKGAGGREGTLIPLAPSASGGQSGATKEFIGI